MRMLIMIACQVAMCPCVLGLWDKRSGNITGTRMDLLGSWHHHINIVLSLPTHLTITVTVTYSLLLTLFMNNLLVVSNCC